MIRIALILATLLGVSQIANAQQTPKAAKKGSAVPLQVAQTILPPPPPTVTPPLAMPPLPVLLVVGGTVAMMAAGAPESATSH